MYGVKIGGSALYDGYKLNTELIKVIKESIKRIKFIVTGGGKFIKDITETLRKELNFNEDSLHRIGIKMTELNATIIKEYLGEIAYPEVLGSPHIPVTNKVIVARGFVPGKTTDYDLVFLAKSLGIKEIVKITDVDGIFNDNPKTNPNAKLIKKMSWDELIEILEKEKINKMKAGGKYPFDPDATVLAKEIGLKMYVINGHKPDIVRKFFMEGKLEVGTVVE